MKKCGADPKVKKTLVRDYERKTKSTGHQKVIRDVESTPELCTTNIMKDTVLSEPTLCSSAALANYLSDIKSARPPDHNLNVDKGELCSKMTRKLNFHFNDKIYKNLIELNASIQELKSTKDKKSAKAVNSMKKDLEPNIEDFCEDVKEADSPPNIPLIKPKFKTIKSVEDGHLHKIISSFDLL